MQREHRIQCIWTSRRVILPAAVAVSGLLVLTACGSSASKNGSSGSKDSSSGTTHFTFALSHTPITPTEEAVEIAVPDQLGFFKAAHVTVSVQPAAGSTAAIQAVAAGSAQVGEASSINIIQAAQKGVPVKGFAAQTLVLPYKIVTLPGSPIKTVADLKGKSLGVTSLASASYDVAKAEVKAANLTGQVTILAVGGGAGAVAALKSNRVSATTDFTDDLHIIQLGGVKLTDIQLPLALNKNYFSVTWFTSDSALKNQRAPLINLTKAMMQGLVWTAAHPADAVLMTYKEFPQLKAAGSKYQAQYNKDVEVIKGTLASISPPTVGGVPGTAQSSDPAQWINMACLAPSAWQTMIGFDENAGELSGAAPSVNEVWDGSLCAAGSKFDNAAIIATPTPK